ncbi:SH3 domain-containing protein [Rhabdochromatium marinum]|uniref:SH3 domain-containing protein n=1 Tax=Rhabdochromatium marinum TaxID=48729 RepID=UPI001904DF57|nr:SH3 domain-containing protein [Rhabdochromatium marinum]MBK1649228.1 hypothetical protein [Rhabdochromatium marinum]
MRLMQAKRGSAQLMTVAALTGLLLAGSLAILPGSAKAANVSIHTTTDLNVRTCPSTSCRVIGVLPAYSCEVAHRWAGGGSWVQITYRGRRAFVSASYVRRGCGRGRR